MSAGTSERIARRAWPAPGWALAVLPAPAHAHASDQGLVLLLPTDAYVAAGSLVVALTVLLLGVLPDDTASRLFRPVRLWRRGPPRAWHVTSVLSCVLFLALIWAGLAGPHDPLKNPLPLFVWTVFWAGFVAIQGLFGNLWAWVNPWSGPAAALRRLGLRPVLGLPARLGHVPALLSFLGFAAFLLADPAPADPHRLARVAGLYWAATLLAVLMFGPRWLRRGECFTVFLSNYARIGVFGRRGGRLRAGLPGWKLLAGRAPPLGLALFMIAMLATGSFDGLNETFWWLGVLGVNPLEFPGRSAVVVQNVTGLGLANAALAAVFLLAVWLGLKLARSGMAAPFAVRLFAPTLLPIALGYHIAHYLTAILVDGQYALLALSDPLGRGDDLLGLGEFYVTTGFFNTPASVRAIWLSQAGAVVAGHVLSVMLAHANAVRAFGSGRRAALSQAPLALFMVAYTVFGLWLLASPRGL
ncbi:MAG: hypothetical protein ACK5MY_03670 [Jhaorihella sp.]